MTDVRAAKIAGIADDIPVQAVELGPETGKLAVVGWGSTYGPINRAVTELHGRGPRRLPHPHAPLWPLPRNLGDAAARLRAGPGAGDEQRPAA